VKTQKGCTGAYNITIKEIIVVVLYLP